jgi:hypothetical protein
MYSSSIVLALLSMGFFVRPAAGQTIGSGDPGLKVVIGNSDSVAIYQDEPQTFGVGLQGGMAKRRILVIVDQGYGFNQRAMDIPKQLFPFDSEAAFTCSGGRWALPPGPHRFDYTPRKYVGYRLVDGRLTVFTDVQKEAGAKYRLSPGEEFLGSVDSRVFYWKDFDPSKVYWRDQTTTKTYSLALPEGVIDLYGVARGLKQDIRLLTLRKSHRLFNYSPYTDEVIEIPLSKGAQFAP